MFGPEIWRFGRFGQPWVEMQRLQNEVNRLFSRLTQAGGRHYPPINVWTGPDEVIVSAELPGIEAEKVEISVLDDLLTLSGTHETTPLKEGETYHRQEINYGRFSRSIQLPFKVEAERVNATYDKGILTITLPRSEKDKPQKIAIKAQ